jgi:prophage regulatory protein
VKGYEDKLMKIMRLDEVMACTGLGRSSIYKMISVGTFPKPVPLMNRSVGWVSYEVESWIISRIEERDLATD